MPFIQVDVRAGLSPEQRVLLSTRIVDIVHDAIGSARAHINVAIREIEPGALVEAGLPVTANELAGRLPAAAG
ncbi:MAG TPA: tautomerase family protein [Streptosporangiaceae bacterium]|nr:tautomerase family protein [Streptosporangiaceae bacterium]